MNYLQFSPVHSVYFVIRGDDMQAERYMVNLNFMTIQCISFLAKRENFRKFSTVFFLVGVSLFLRAILVIVNEMGTKPNHLFIRMIEFKQWKTWTNLWMNDWMKKKSSRKNKCHRSFTITVQHLINYFCSISFWKQHKNCELMIMTVRAVYCAFWVCGVAYKFIGNRYHCSTKYIVIFILDTRPRPFAQI